MQMPLEEDINTEETVCIDALRCVSLVCVSYVPACSKQEVIRKQSVWDLGDGGIDTEFYPKPDCSYYKIQSHGLP